MVEKGDGHYVQNNRLVVGRNIYQKPMPKQDKGGGINPPPRELACGLEGGAAGRQNAASLLALLRLLLALNTRETRVWNFSYNLAYKIDEVKQRVYTYNKV